MTSERAMRVERRLLSRILEDLEACEVGQKKFAWETWGSRRFKFSGC